jgi:hypothetical protein
LQGTRGRGAISLELLRAFIIGHIFPLPGSVAPTKANGLEREVRVFLLLVELELLVGVEMAGISETVEDGEDGLRFVATVFAR